MTFKKIKVIWIWMRLQINLRMSTSFTGEFAVPSTPFYRDLQFGKQINFALMTAEQPETSSVTLIDETNCQEMPAYNQREPIVKR